MGLLSSSKKTTTNLYDYSQTDNSMLASGLGSTTVSGSGNKTSTSIIQNDASMVEEIAALGFDSLTELGADAFYSAEKLGTESFDLSERLGLGAFDLGQDAFDLSGTMNRDNVGFLTRIGESLISSAGKTQSESLSLAEEATRNSMDLVSNFTEREQLGASAGQADALKWVAMAAVVVAGLVMVRGRK